MTDGNIYEGAIQKGAWHGIGRIDYTSKQFTYTGELCQGKRQGFGRLESDSYMYAGGWEGDKKNGIGYQSITNGATYYGEWQNNVKEGLGYEIGTSFNYKGEWKNDKPQRQLY